MIRHLVESPGAIKSAQFFSGGILLRISVVIPVYQRQADIQFALRSLASEAELIHEVIVVDDASPNPITISPPPAIANRTKLVRLPENRGSAAARQAAIDLSTGELIAFLDSDDAWLPGKLAAQLPFFATDEEMLAVATGWQVLDLDRGTTSVRMPLPAVDPVDFASGCWFCPGSTVTIRRAALTRCGPFDTNLKRLEDLDWFLRFALAGGRLAVAEVPGALIRRVAKSNRTDVENAAAVIFRRFSQHPGIDRSILRHLSAWLDVERAFSAWTEGDRLAAAKLFLKSQLRIPRKTIQLRDWWHVYPPTLSLFEAKRLLGISS